MSAAWSAVCGRERSERRPLRKAQPQAAPPATTSALTSGAKSMPKVCRCGTKAFQLCRRTAASSPSRIGKTGLGCPCATNTFAMMVPTSCSAGRAVSATQRKPCCRAAQPGPALAFQAPSFGARPHAAASQRRAAGGTHLAVLHVYPLGRAQLPYFTVLRVEHGRARLYGAETHQPFSDGGWHVHDGCGLRPRHGLSAREAGWTAARCSVWRPFALACAAGAVRAAGGDRRAGRTSCWLDAIGSALQVCERSYVCSTALHRFIFAHLWRVAQAQPERPVVGAEVVVLVLEFQRRWALCESRRSSSSRRACQSAARRSATSAGCSRSRANAWLRLFPSQLRLRK